MSFTFVKRRGGTEILFKRDGSIVMPYVHTNTRHASCTHIIIILRTHTSLSQTTYCSSDRSRFVAGEIPIQIIIIIILLYCAPGGGSDIFYLNLFAVSSSWWFAGSLDARTTVTTTKILLLSYDYISHYHIALQYISLYHCAGEEGKSTVVVSLSLFHHCIALKRRKTSWHPSVQTYIYIYVV